jgi:hypothetical protein
MAERQAGGSHKCVCVEDTQQHDVQEVALSPALEGSQIAMVEVGRDDAPGADAVFAV